MKFEKASVKDKMDAARARDPATFDRLIASARIGPMTDCWPVTTRARNRDGYTLLRVRGTKQRSHRAMFSLFYPDVPAPVVRHVCNNPACINPAHLRAGTPRDNAHDRMHANRGGNLRGENNGRSVLTEEQVRAIRSSQLSGAELGRRYGVSKNMACRIKCGLAWGHVKGDRQ